METILEKVNSIKLYKENCDNGIYYAEVWLIKEDKTIAFNSFKSNSLNGIIIKVKDWILNE